MGNRPKVILFALVMALLLFQAPRTRAQSPLLDNWVLIAAQGWTVTLSKAGEPLGSFDVPKGVSLGVWFNSQQPHSRHDAPALGFEFHGDIELHTQTASATYDMRFHPEKSEAQQLRESALSLAGQSVDLFIEPAHRQ